MLAHIQYLFLIHLFHLPQYKPATGQTNPQVWGKKIPQSPQPIEYPGHKWEVIEHFRSSVSEGIFLHGKYLVQVSIAFGIF